MNTPETISPVTRLPLTLGLCAAWLHWAEHGSPLHGVVVCGTLAHEDAFTRTSLARLAEALAARGLPTLRLDLTGSGHSAPLADTDDVLAQWTRDLEAAVALLRGQLGCTQVTVIGLRLGASVALAKAAALQIDQLVLMAPVVSGVAYTRQLRAQNVILPEDQLTALRTLDLRQPLVRPAPKMFVQFIERDATASALEQQLEALGTELWSARCVGLDKLLGDPNTAEFAPSLTAVCDWVVRHAGVPSPLPLRHPITVPQGSIHGTHWHETAHVLGPQGTLVGVLTRPSTNPKNRVLMILNDGATPSVGAQGSTVRLARALARHGLATLRLDLPGLGDSLQSGPFPAKALGVSALLADTQRQGLTHVLDWLCVQKLDDISLMGSGSGAYHAFHLTLEEARINKVFLINPPCFENTPSNVLRLVSQTHDQTRRATRRVQTALHPESSATLPTLADLTLPLAGKFAASSVSALTSLAALAGNPTGTGLVESWFRELSARGTQVDLIYTAQDPSLAALDRVMGRHGRFATCLPLVERHVLDTEDATLASPAAFGALHGIIAARFGIPALDVDTLNAPDSRDSKALHAA